jgi:hypothetical protein
MRRNIIAILSVLLLVGSTASTVFAASPHFVTASASGPANDGTLKVNFKLAGLGDSETVTITTSADATAVYACRNNGGNFPADPKKTTVAGPVSASGDFTSGKNGQITGSLTLSPPPPPNTLTCPGGQRLVLISVSYTNVTVSGAGDTEILGSFSRTFFTI